MRVVSRRALREFHEKHPDAKGPLDVWYQIVRRKDYKSPHQMQEDFASVSLLGDEIAVFNIGGNKYRLVVHFRYDLGRVYVRHVLTHAEYDRAMKAGTLVAERWKGGGP